MDVCLRRMRGEVLYLRSLLVHLYGNLEHVFTELGHQKSQFRISMQTPVENPLMTIESFTRQFQIREKERGALNERIKRFCNKFNFAKLKRESVGQTTVLAFLNGDKDKKDPLKKWEIQKTLFEARTSLVRLIS